MSLSSKQQHKPAVKKNNFKQLIKSGKQKTEGIYNSITTNKQPELLINSTNKKWTYKKKVIVLTLAFALIRLFIASYVELGNDESYYWLYSQHLKWNYFDHPPMIALWIRIFSFNLSLQQYTGFLRLCSVVSCAVSGWFMYKTVSYISNERAGWFAACFYNASFYAGITAGIFIMPDTPQMVFYTLSLLMIAKIINDDNKWLNWVLFGITAGLCIMSKVHGVFLWAGMGLYTLFYKREWLKKQQLYSSVLISFVICLPILIWNIKHNFITYNFDSQRVDINGFGVNWLSFITEVCGQFIINNPFNVIAIVTALIIWRRNKKQRMAVLSIYNLIGLPLAFLLLFIALYRQTLPHWSGPAYIALIPLAAITVDRKTRLKASAKTVWLSVGGHVLFLIVCTLAIHFYPGTLGSKSEKDLGTGDLTLDMYGWKEAGQQFDSIYTHDLQQKIIAPATPVVCYKWWGAHQEYYFTRPIGIQMIGLGGILNLHEYMWMNKIRKSKVNFASAYCIEPSDEIYDVNNMYKDYYKKIEQVSDIKIYRNGKPAHNFYIYRLTGWKGKLPVAR